MMQFIIKEDTDNQRNMHNFVQGFVENKTSGYLFVKNSAPYSFINADDEYFIITDLEKFEFFSIQDITDAIDEYKRVYFTSSAMCFVEEGKLLKINNKEEVKEELLIHATSVLGIYVFVLKGKYISNKCKDTDSIRTSNGMESLLESIFSYSTKEKVNTVGDKYFCSSEKLTFDIFRDDIKELITQPLEEILEVVTPLSYKFNMDKTIELDLNRLKGGVPFNIFVKGNVSLAMPFECTIYGA